MDFSMLRSGKRARSDSISSTSSIGSNLGSEASASSSLVPHNKISRSSPTRTGNAGSKDLECNLPPTCFPESRTFGTSSELERHQLAFHTFICRTPVRDKKGGSSTRTQAGTNGAAEGVWDLPREFVSRNGGDKWTECRKVFPDQRLLDLHQCECHDHISRQKQRDGLSIFQCFVPPPECTRLFITPKQRRHHLIQKHKYPEQYYFGITNHGLNRIAEEEGLGASLIRPRREYPRTPNKPITPTLPRRPHPNELRPGVASGPAPGAGSGIGAGAGAGANELVTGTGTGTGSGIGIGIGHGDGVVDVDMDDLTKGMRNLESSLSFVPSQVRRKNKGKGKGKEKEKEIDKGKGKENTGTWDESNVQLMEES